MGVAMGEGEGGCVGEGVSDGVGEGEGEGVGEGEGTTEGVGLGIGVTETVGVATGEGVGDGVGITSGKGLGLGLKLGTGDTAGDGAGINVGIGFVSCLMSLVSPPSYPFRRAIASQSNFPLLAPLSSLTTNPYGVLVATYNCPRMPLVVGVTITRKGTLSEMMAVNEKSKNIFASPATKFDVPLSCISPLVESTP